MVEINLNPMGDKLYIIHYPITTINIISEKNTDIMHNDEKHESNEVYDWMHNDEVVLQEGIEISKCMNIQPFNHRVLSPPVVHITFCDEITAI